MAIERVDIDFSPATRRTRPLGLVLLALGMASVVASGLVWGGAWARHRQQSQALVALERGAGETAPAVRRPATPTPADMARARAAQRVAHDLQAPWADLLSALESAPAKNVALLSVEPSATRQQLRLTAEARDAEAMIDYVAALQAEPRLSQVTLASHQVQMQTPGRPTRFTVQAAWGTSP